MFHKTVKIQSQPSNYILGLSLGVTCTDTPNGPVCGSCPDGYKGDGRRCELIDTCATLRPCYPGMSSQLTTFVFSLPILQSWYILSALSLVFF